MQFSWAESPSLEMGDHGDTKPSSSSMAAAAGDAYEETLYGGDLQLFESFFNGNLNELDYLTDLPVLDASSAAVVPSDSEAEMMPSCSSIDALSSFIKNEPASPSLSPFVTSSPVSSSSPLPGSPGESSGPSSPETTQHISLMACGSSLETINPASLLMMPGALEDDAAAAHHFMASPSMGQHQLVEVKKASGGGNKRGRFSSDEDVSSPPTPLPANCSPDEERQIKRQRRLIKNRESAQKSRLRKKMYIEDLEAKVKTVVTQNEMLLQENTALKEEIRFLTKFINKTPGLAEEIASNRPKGAANATPAIRNVKAAGVCLLIVLFSFGLFFNNVQQYGDNGPALPFEGRSREPIPEVVPFGGERRYGRMLKSFKDAVPSLVSETEEVGGDLTQIFPKRRLPPVEENPLDSVIQRNKKVGSGLSPYKKIKVEEDSMDVVDPSCAEEVAKGFLSVAELPEIDGLLTDEAHFEEFVSQGPRNDTGAETTGHTDN